MAQSPKVIVHIDGGSRGNPGPAAYGVVIDSADGSRLAAFSGYLGKATNNVAEYQGLIAALDHVLRKHYLRVHVRTDSELLELQIKGVYKVKSPGLKPLHERALELISRLESFSIEHVPRERNREADGLANRALDEAQSGRRRRTVDPPSLASLPEEGAESQVGKPLAPPVQRGETGVEDFHVPHPTPEAESGVGERLAAFPTLGGEAGVGNASKGSRPLRVAATFCKGLLEPHEPISLFEGEVVDLVIYRKE
jgi:probable phosphoglycerate mutase